MKFHLRRLVDGSPLQAVHESDQSGSAVASDAAEIGASEHIGHQPRLIFGQVYSAKSCDNKSMDNLNGKSNGTFG
jgi:hypothetical protein